MKASTLHAMMAAAFAATFLVACGSQAENNEEGVLEQAGATADEAVSDLRDGFQDALQEGEEAAEDAGEALETTAQEAGEAVNDAAEAAHGLAEGEQVEPEEAPK